MDQVYIYIYRFIDKTDYIKKKKVKKEEEVSCISPYKLR